MKQLLPLFLFLLPCLAWAQYPSNGNQKITLGEQTTADGLIWRGVAADTTLTAKSDTAAYFVLDTVNKKLYFYKVSAIPKWNEISGSGGGGGVDSTAIAYVNTYGTQTVNGVKTFTDTMRIEDAIKVGANNAYVYSAGTGNYYFTKDFKNQSGTYAIAIGDGVLKNATTVSNPTSSRVGTIAIGFNNLQNMVQTASTNNAVWNTSVGYNNMISITTGGFNTGLGANSLVSLTTGGSNVALGTTTLSNMTTGGSNLGIGDGALRFLTTGSSNIGIGSNAGIFRASDGQQVTSLDNSIYIGQRADPSGITGVTNEIVIGKEAKGQGSNSIMLGNSSVTNAYCYDTSLSSPSDFRDKTNIENLQTGLDLIMNLRPVKFQWNMRDYGKVGYKDIGFIAQEALDVQNVNNEADNIKLVSDENQNQLSMQSANLIPILVKAIQDQQAQIELLKQRLLILENK
jgi:hypothetical protein